LIQLERIQAAAQSIDPVFLNSPQFESDSLSADLGFRIVLKVETVNPIRSFKGRGADFWVAGLPANPPNLICASAGNFGQGLAYAGRKRGIPVTVFTAQNANRLKVDRMRQLGADVHLAGSDFDEAKQHARAFAEESGALFVEDGREPAITEGAGTIAVELCRWPIPFDIALVPLGDGALLAGIGTWMKAHSPGTRIIGVCAAGAPALALSLARGVPVSTESTTTIADGIAVRVPVPESLTNLAGVIDEVLLVEDDALIAAMQLAFRHHGLVIEPAGAAGLAAAVTFRDRFRGAHVVTPLCGGNLTPEQISQWL
jgi:threonine dehydratase